MLKAFGYRKVRVAFHALDPSLLRQRPARAEPGHANSRLRHEVMSVRGFLSGMTTALANAKHRAKSGAREKKMRSRSMIIVTTLAACGGGTSTPALPDAALGVDAQMPDAAKPDSAMPNAPDAGPSATLTLVLDPSLDGDTDDVKATSITSAELLDKSGSSVGHATIASGQALFNLGAVAAGDYFVEVNGLGDDLVPTRIDKPVTSVAQRVGQKLRASVIGPTDNPVYRINTYSAGQMQSPVVKYSDGSPVAGEQPYVLLTLVTPKIELRVLGTGALLGSPWPAADLHQGTNVPFDAWILNTEGQPHHGDAYNDNPGSCVTCHLNMTTKPASHTSIDPASGWCYQCHYGATGDESGFVDPTK
jgi:hypothetical protein